MPKWLTRMRKSRRLRWFSEHLTKRRLARELGRTLWAMTPCVTPAHKVMRLGLWWYVSEFDGRWRVVGRFATERQAINTCADRFAAMHPQADGDTLARMVRGINL